MRVTSTQVEKYFSQRNFALTPHRHGEVSHSNKFSVSA